MIELRIAHITSVIDGRSQSGTARVAKELISELSKHGNIHQVLVHFGLSTDGVYSLPNIEELKIPLIYRSIPGRHFISFLIYCLKNRKTLNSLRLDVVHWHVGRVYPFFWLLPSKSIVITLHDAGGYVLKGVNTLWTRLFRLFMWLSYRRVNYFLAVSITARLALFEHASRFRGKLEYLYPATRIHQLNSRMPITNFPLESPFILCVSRWQPHKNVDSLVKAYFKVLEEYPFAPNLVLVGKSIGNYMEIDQLLSVVPMKNKVHVLSYVQDAELRYLYERCYFSVFPSLHEGFGLAVLESMSLKKAVLVHRYTATAEILGIEELSIDMTNISAIADMIAFLIENPSKVQNFNNEAFQMSKRFSWDQTAKRLVSLYVKSIGGK